MRRRILMLTAVLLLALSSSVQAFPDSEGHSNSDKIAALQQEGVLKGEPDGKFYPDSRLTYAAGVTALVKGLDVSLAKFLFIKAPEASDFYTGVKDGRWYSDSFIIANVNGIDIPRDVKPGNPVTREQFARYLLQAIETNGEFVTTMQYIQVTDEAEINSAYSGSIQKLLISGIITLDGDGKFHPGDPITRGEAAGWIYEARAFAKTLLEQQ